MRGTNTLENVIGQVHEMATDNYDDFIPVRDMSFESLERIDIVGQSYGVLPSAQRLLANRLRVPHSYLARCPQELQSQNLNYWIKLEGKQRETFFCRFAGNQLRAVFTQRYTAIDHMEILSHMVEHGFDPLAEVQYCLDESLVVVKVPEYD